VYRELQVEDTLNGLPNCVEPLPCINALSIRNEGNAGEYIESTGFFRHYAVRLVFSHVVHTI
jgi:hypothetical protein